jgi:hypothetical protein
MIFVMNLKNKLHPRKVSEEPTPPSKMNFLNFVINSKKRKKL